MGNINKCFSKDTYDEMLDELDVAQNNSTIRTEAENQNQFPGTNNTNNASHNDQPEVYIKRYFVHLPSGPPWTNKVDEPSSPSDEIVIMKFPLNFSGFVAFEPATEMTAAEAESIKTYIQKQCYKEATKKGSRATPPAFSGQPTLVNGMLQIWSANEYTLEWLENCMKNLTLRSNTRLILIRRFTIGLFLPSYSEKDLMPAYSILKYQNQDLDFDKWAPYNAVRVYKPKEGTFFTVIVPLDEVKKVLEKDRRIHFSHCTIMARFLVKGKLQNDPPHPQLFTGEELNKVKQIENNNVMEAEVVFTENDTKEMWSPD